MINLHVSDAVELVRKNLDELDPNGSIMLDDENGSSAEFGDNSSLNDIIARSLPEAINSVHLAAPVQLLEGKSPGEDDYSTLDVDDKGVLTIGLEAGLNFLRLVSFQTRDSDIVVTEVIGEATPEGRKQLNPYICGRHDCPRLVQLQGWRYLFKYYSMNTEREEEFQQLAEDPYSAIADFQYVPEYSFDAAIIEYEVCSRLKQNIIDCLTAKVLEIYGSQQAQVFWQKANSYLTI